MKKILFSLLLVVMIVSLASCKDEIVNNPNNDNTQDNTNQNQTDSNGGITNNDTSDDDNKKPTNTDQIENNDSTQSGSNTGGTTTVTPDYKTPGGEYIESNTPSASSPVETTVELVYDSVVSINVSGLGFTSSGSGVLFQEDSTLGLSYIVTCFHVIENGTSIEIVLSNGDTYKSSVVAGYEDQDLAVLSIEKTGLNYAALFNDSNSLKLGSQVVCIGNPLGTLPGSVSSGYLSYINREIYIDNYQSMKLLQTDVAINSGNSGGGLFNTSGALIGIVNAKYADEAIEGLGFAIPINTVKDVIADFFETAKYDAANKKWQEGYYGGDWELGVTISDGYYGGGFSGYTSVVYISAIADNDTASGGETLVLEDIITSANIDYAESTKTDKTIDFTNATTLLQQIYSAELTVGDKIVFGILRSNTTQTVVVELKQFIYSI